MGDVFKDEEMFSKMKKDALPQGMCMCIYW